MHWAKLRTAFNECLNKLKSYYKVIFTVHQLVINMYYNMHYFTVFIRP
jgi:hypothetical protein